MDLIRESGFGDLAEIERIYASAFPEEDLISVVRELLNFGADVLSLVAVKNAAIVGHVILSPCTVAAVQASLLAPLCVDPPHHKQGIGTALIEAGFARAKQNGIDFVYVLGDPNYYGRLGFKAETGVFPPYPLPQDWQDIGAWQSFALSDVSPPTGELQVLAPWRKSEYWGA